MPRSVFFSFAYEDVINFKVNVVRNSWLLKHRSHSFVDGSIWESEITKKAQEIKNLIDLGLTGTSVTCILVGANTADRRWVKYEIVKSFEKGNGLLAVHINRIKGRIGITPRGQNPLDRLGIQVSDDGRHVSFYELSDRRWWEFSDLPSVSNKRSNSLYFDDYRFLGNFYRFSDLFGTLCWDLDCGNDHFATWIEMTAQQVGR